MSTDEPNRRVIADFASEAVQYGLIRPSQVVVWADELVAGSEVPPAWLLDVSLVDISDVLAVRAVLRAVPGQADRNASLGLLNALVLREWKRGNLTIGKVRGIGWQLYSADVDRTSITEWGVLVECQAESLDEGYISEAQMGNIIDRELEPYSSQVARLPSWA